MASFPGFDTPAYGQIGGALPWGGGGGAQAIYGAASGNPAAIASGYQQQYNNSLAQNQSMYNNILAGYQQTLAQHSTAQQAIQAGYSNLYNDVLAKVSGIGQARSNQINIDASRQLASGTQSLIDKGLGNTTITSSVGAGVEANRNQAQLALSDQLEQMQGGFMSQLGLAGLQNQQYGLDQSTNLAQNQLGFMNSVKAGYPDAGLYGSLAQTAAQTAAAKRLGLNGGGSFAAPGSPGPKLGYVPGSNYYGAGAADPGAGVGVGGGGSWMMDQYAAAPGAAQPAGAGVGGAIGMLGSEMGQAPQAGYGLAGLAYGMAGMGDYGGGGDF